jgi:hypothetical protein
MIYAGIEPNARKRDSHGRPSGKSGAVRHEQRHTSQ